MKFTNFLIILCIFLSLYFWGSNENLAFSEYALFHVVFHTLLTGLFVHANLVHLSGNTIFLYVFGSSLRHGVGALNTALVFFTGGILSFIVSIPFYPGASMLASCRHIFSDGCTLACPAPGIFIPISFTNRAPCAFVFYFQYNGC